MTIGVEEIVNQALVGIGYPERIGSINDGSKAAIAALEVFGQTRDELLVSGDWPFARRTEALSLLKGPPPAGGYNPNEPWTTSYPAPGWLYEYLYPDDCLDLGAIIAPPGLMFDLDPKPAVYRIDNDNSYTPGKKVILTNVKSALAVFVGQVTDLTLWEPGFIETLGKALETKLALWLKGELQVERETIAEGDKALAMAEQRRG